MSGLVRLAAGTLLGVLLWPVFLVFCLAARANRARIDVGLGPHPLINNVYHKRALERRGYRAETFVYKTYFITGEFDIDVERRLGLRSLPLPLNRMLAALAAFVLAAWRYRILYIYFNGGPLGIFPGLLRYSEAFFLRLAGVKVVAMPYGSDVQDMRRSPNLAFKNAMTLSYPGRGAAADRRAAANIDYWTQRADHVVSGVEWVDYMASWDTLMLGHFSIDCDALRPPPPSPREPGRPLRVLHAPNHRHIKGTDAVIAAVEALRSEGHAIELALVEKRPNSEVLAEIAGADLVIDQLVIGWYAMFALEAMALGKPVVCHIRPDLEELYRKAGLLDEGELPFLRADTLSLRSVLEEVLRGARDLAAAGDSSRRYVERRHSLDAIGAAFDRINRSLGVVPRADR